MNFLFNLSFILLPCETPVQQTEMMGKYLLLASLFFFLFFFFATEKKLISHQVDHDYKIYH